MYTVDTEVYRVDSEVYTVDTEMYTVDTEVYTVDSEVCTVDTEMYTVDTEVYTVIRQSGFKHSVFKVITLPLTCHNLQYLCNRFNALFKVKSERSAILHLI
jgi:hypothetical protein